MSKPAGTPDPVLREIARGVCVGEDGTLHLNVPEILVANGYSDTPENREMLTRAARELACKAGAIVETD